MTRIFSQRLRLDVDTTVHAALTLDGVVNVPVLAEAIRRRNQDENVAREDIEHLVMQRAQSAGGAMAFASRESPDFPWTAPLQDGHDRA